MKEETFVLMWLMTSLIIPTGKVHICCRLTQAYQNCTEVK